MIADNIVPRETFEPDAAAIALRSADILNETTHLAHPSPLHGPVQAGLVQPVLDVPEYLKNRERAFPHFDSEMELFITLPDEVRSELRLFLGEKPGSGFVGGAFGLVQSLVKGGLSVSSACVKAFQKYPRIRIGLKRFRAYYDEWSKLKDWTYLVDCTRAGVAWQKGSRGIPREFLVFCASRFGEYKRADSKRQALFSIKRQWRTGLNEQGEPEPIPGYGYWQDWFKKQYGPARVAPTEAPIPDGWHYSNLLDQIKIRNVFPKAVEALLHEGTSAATNFLPQSNRTRSELRFMEEVHFDDVKTDWRVIDPDTGEVMDLWLLVARDLATTLLLGFGMRPARARDDGSQEHLKLTDMKQLLGWLLERFGLPPYAVHWVFEQGTATVAKGSVAALRELLGCRIVCHFTSMVGGESPAGYAERAKGNSRGKASLECHNRLLHTMAAALPGQTGPHYGVRPADLIARENEAVEIWKLAQHLPRHLRGEVQYPLLTIRQARRELVRIFNLQNIRTGDGQSGTDHKIEGFEEIAEWFDESSGKWKHQSTCPDRVGRPGGNPRTRVRIESPLERAIRLGSGLQWSGVSPEIITAFYEHTQRSVKLEPNGLIKWPFEGSYIWFLRPDGAPQLPGTGNILAYCHADDPRFLHLTNGKRAMLGTWIRRDRAKDQETLAEAIRYNTAALNAAREYADQLNADERERLESMRAHNAEVMKMNSFIEVSQPALQSDSTIVQSPVASAFSAIAVERAQSKAAAKREAAAAADAILAPRELASTDSAAADDLLSALTSH